MTSNKTEIFVSSSSHRPRPVLDLLDIVQRMCVTQVLQGILGLFLAILYLWHLVSRLCASLPFFFHLRNIFKIRKFFYLDSAKTLVHAFITSKVDYCTSLLYGQPKCVLRDLQRVLNCSAGHSYSTSKFEHVTQTFLNLHLLPVEQRIIFKIALATFKALHDFVPSYITELIRPYKPDRTLRSSIHIYLLYSDLILKRKVVAPLQLPLRPHVTASFRITTMYISFSLNF